MTEKIFMVSLANGKVDVLQQFFSLLEELKIEYCVIGGLAVNAYVEPVVSLDLDVVVTTAKIKQLGKAAEKSFKIKKFHPSLNLESSQSQLRIQLQTDPRYQTFIPNATTKTVLGYEMKVAALKDVLQGKVWAYSDEQKRASKRQKDLADIFRLIETYPYLKDMLPESIQASVN